MQYAWGYFREEVCLSRKNDALPQVTFNWVSSKLSTELWPNKLQKLYKFAKIKISQCCQKSRNSTWRQARLSLSNFKQPPRCRSVDLPKATTRRWSWYTWRQAYCVNTKLGVLSSWWFGFGPPVYSRTVYLLVLCLLMHVWGWVEYRVVSGMLCFCQFGSFC